MVFQNNSQKAFLSHNVSETPVGCVPVGNGGTGRCGEGTRVGSQAAFREMQLSWVWEVNERAVARRSRWEGFPSRGKAKTEAQGYVWKTVCPGSFEEFGLTREDVRGMGEAQGRQDR